MRRFRFLLAIALVTWMLLGSGVTQDIESTVFSQAMVPVGGCEMISQKGEIIISGPTRDRSLIQTQRAFKPPFVLRLRAKTDSTNLRLYYNAGMVIFNWEIRKTELRVHDIVSDKIRRARGKGYITPNEWHDILWEIKGDGMRILVDGEERYRSGGDYSDIEAPIGIGPAFGSVLSVASFEVGSL